MRRITLRAELIKRYGRSLQTFIRWEKQRLIPPSHLVGPRLRGWDTDVIMAALRELGLEPKQIESEPR